MSAISPSPTFPPIGSPTFNADAYAWAVYLAGTFTNEVNAAIVAMNAIAAGGAVSLQYTFSSTTTDSDPGAGVLRLSSATQNTSTVIRADLVGVEGSDLTGVLNLLDDSTSTTKGYITLRKVSDAAKWLVFAITALASPTGYKNITVTCAASSSANPFTNGDALLFDFTPTGDKGDTGTNGTNGTNGAAGAVGPNATFVDKGNSGTTTQTLNFSAGQHQKITVTGAHTIATSNWPAAGTLGEMVLELTNGAAFAVTWPTINWIKSDGSFTTTFSSNGVTLQTSGTDFFVLWSRDGGTTIYGKALR